MPELVQQDGHEVDEVPVVVVEAVVPAGESRARRRAEVDVEGGADVGVRADEEARGWRVVRAVEESGAGLADPQPAGADVDRADVLTQALAGQRLRVPGVRELRPGERRVGREVGPDEDRPGAPEG